jgi:hypothetical protein
MVSKVGLATGALGAWLSLLAVSSSAGCSMDFCDEFFDGDCTAKGGGGQGGDGGSTTTTSAGGNGQGGNGGEGGGIPVDCDPLAVAAGTAIPASCGLFVDSASLAAGESGTQAAPYKSLAAALGAAAADQPIYVCTSPLDEAALIESDARLYGGLDCATWTTGAAAARTAWTAPANEIPLAVHGAGVSATVAGFAVTARDAAGSHVASGQGRSSIAAWVEQASVHLERVELLAGQGAPGADGLPQAKVATPGAADGTAGGAGCLGNAGTFGATPGEQTCGTVVVDGGLGGNGTSAANGGNGSDGEPLGTMGKGGKGETASMPIACANGGEGATGGSGTPGSGASESSFGTLSAMTYVGPAGSTGLAAGVPGQGGGGGGGANLCTTGMQGAGPSGGGGGAGGCGGNPGNGGGGGGGSLGLVSVNATISVVNSTITASHGGIRRDR